MDILARYFASEGFTRHQTSSFDWMVREGLQQVVAEESTIDVSDSSKQMRYLVEFGQVHIGKPCSVEDDRTVVAMTPHSARERSATYDAALSIDIRTTLEIAGVVKETKELNRHPLGKIPIMVNSSRCTLFNMSEEEKVRSGECPHDPGGYFILKGCERVLIGQERGAYNMIGAYKQKKSSKWEIVAEVRSISETTGHSVLLQGMIDSKGRNVVLSLPYIGLPMPVGIVFLALGLTLDDMLQILDPQDDRSREICAVIMRECKMAGGAQMTKQEALEYIGKQAMHSHVSADKYGKYASQILENEMLPHMGSVTHKNERCIFVASLVRKLIDTFTGRRPPDDRDNLSRKRFEVSGVLICILFRSLFKRLVRSLHQLVSKRPDISVALGRFNTITQGFRTCFGTGKWGVQKNSYVRQGVAQVMQRLTYAATLSHLNRVVIPIGKEGKNVEIRQLHPSQIFFICLYETPEGHASGINKNFSLLCDVTNGVSTALVRDQIDEVASIEPVTKDHLVSFKGLVRVLLNGIVIGVTRDAEGTCRELRELRDSERISREVSIAFDDIDAEVHIASDAGRLIRPLFTVGDGNSLPKLPTQNWNELIKSGRIKYRDPAELENCVVAMNDTRLTSGHAYDFQEIHPSMMMGVCASNIPFPDHSQSPRNTYQSAMGKQALGRFALSNRVRVDTIVHTLDYPQVPLTSTKAATFMGFDKLTAGQNVTVAITPYQGFNQEDSICINKAAVDRGLFRATTFRTISYNEKKRGTSFKEVLGVPPLDDRRRFYNYHKLGDDGIIKVGSKVEKGDVVIGRYLEHCDKSTGKKKIRDCSIAAKNNETGVVDMIVHGTTPEGHRFVKVKIRRTRIPEIGDKLASRSAQKGTIGAVVPEEDMPWDPTGQHKIDIMINPHCIPSRMTINQIIESFGSLLTIVSGQKADATAFSEASDNAAIRIKTALEERGLDSTGTTKLVNGHTGEDFKSVIFVGNTYYQRLKHMVDEKVHARAHGDLQVLTRQPLEGRSREGGMRAGEMERDCLLGHGASAFLGEKLLELSDYFEMDICRACKTPSNPDSCTICGTDDIAKVKIPYACKLLFHELEAMSLKVGIVPE